MNGVVSRSGPEEGALRAVERLRERLDEAEVEAGETVWRFVAAGAVPHCVVRPSSVESVGVAVRMAREHCMALVPSGNGTHLDIGFPPQRYDAAVSTRRLRQIVAHDAGDMTVTAQAGVTLAELNETLGSVGQWLPLDPPRADSVTLGGLIAADRNGPLRLVHGKVRDHLIGLKVVTGSGLLVQGGGRVVKNVAGYDLPKLFSGSFGTLGVIVEASFKVRPRPAEEALFLWRMDSLEEAVRQALVVRDSGVFPVLLEAINEPAAETIGLATGPALLVGCAGGTAEVAAQEECLTGLARDAASRCENAHGESLLKALRDFPHPATEDTVVARISTVPTGLPPLLKRIEAEAIARHVLVEIAAHAGSGVAWCQVLGTADVQTLSLFAEWMRVSTREHDGWLVFEALPATLRGRIDPWGFSDSTVPLMARVKRALDPGATFSPGRFVGGI